MKTSSIKINFRTNFEIIIYDIKKDDELNEFAYERNCTSVNHPI
jgi:hypothetical protein